MKQHAWNYYLSTKPDNIFTNRHIICGKQVLNGLQELFHCSRHLLFVNSRAVGDKSPSSVPSYLHILPVVTCSLKFCQFFTGWRTREICRRRLGISAKGRPTHYRLERPLRRRASRSVSAISGLKGRKVNLTILLFSFSWFFSRATNVAGIMVVIIQVIRPCLY